MKEKSEWTAKLALTCYLALVGGIFMASLIMGIALLGLRTDYLDLPFPIALISIPVSETIILGQIQRFRFEDTGLEKGKP